MTVKEKLILMDEIKKINDERVQKFLEEKKKEESKINIGCKAVELGTGKVVHITGKYRTCGEMAQVLLKDGFVVLNWWKEE